MPIFQLWGVDIVSGNAVNWLDCVAKGQKVTLKPIGRDKEDLVSTVILHLPGNKVILCNGNGILLYKIFAYIKNIKEKYLELVFKPFVI